MDQSSIDKLSKGWKSIPDDLSSDQTAFKGVQSVKINENILRSETAVISAISIVNYVIN